MFSKKACVQWQSFFAKNVGKSNRLCTCLGHLGQFHTDRIISFCIPLPKVAKSSSVVTAAVAAAVAGSA